MSYSDRAYMHGYCSIYICMHNFTSTYVGIFLAKMCKMKEFLYYRRVSTDSCDERHFCIWKFSIAL